MLDNCGIGEDLMPLVIATLTKCPITHCKLKEDCPTGAATSRIISILKTLPKTRIQHLEVGGYESEKFLSSQLSEMMGYVNSCKTLVGLSLSFLNCSSDSIQKFGMVRRSHLQRLI